MVRMTDSDWARVKAQAALRGMTIQHYVQRALLHQIVDDEQLLVLRNRTIQHYVQQASLRRGVDDERPSQPHPLGLSVPAPTPIPAPPAAATVQFPTVHDPDCPARSTGLLESCQCPYGPWLAILRDEDDEDDEAQ